MADRKRIGLFEITMKITPKQNRNVEFVVGRVRAVLSFVRNHTRNNPKQNRNVEFVAGRMGIILSKITIKTAPER